MFKQTVRALALILLVTSLLACSGGGDAGNTNPPPNTDWDQLVWDQDNWQ